MTRSKLQLYYRYLGLVRCSPSRTIKGNMSWELDRLRPKNIETEDPLTWRSTLRTRLNKKNSEGKVTTEHRNLFVRQQT